MTEQQIGARRVFFGPRAEALSAANLPEPVALLGSTRSAATIAGEDLGGLHVDRWTGARLHNPRETVEEARRFIDAHGSRSIIAVGSSSAIDLGKAVWDGRDVLLALVPTALGGAEMSRGYGMVEDGRKGGGLLRAPAPVVIYDAELLATLPPRELGSIGINGWAHTIEALYARREHALGTAAAIEGGRRFPRLLREAATRRDDAIHGALFEAAHLAGFALDARSMGLHHAVCHVVGGMTLIPHGIVNAIVLPHAVRANAELAPAAVESVGRALGIDDLAREAEAIARAYALPRNFGQLGVPADLPQRALPLVMAHPLLRNNPVMPDEATVGRLLQRACAS